MMTILYKPKCIIWRRVKVNQNSRWRIRCLKKSCKILNTDFLPQIIEELETYDSHANQSYMHTWYYGEEVYQKVYFPAPTYATDANMTFTVSRKELKLDLPWPYYSLDWSL